MLQSLGSSPARKALARALSSGVGNSVDFTTQATVSADRRYVRLSLAPVFETVTNVQSGPIVTNPLIPGGMQFSRP